MKRNLFTRGAYARAAFLVVLVCASFIRVDADNTAQSIPFFQNWDNPDLITAGKTNLRVSYRVRDLDASADNATQQVALHYRVGDSGNFTNLPGGYVPDATEQGSATKETFVSVLLPSAIENQPLVQLRIMTTNAGGNDELVGIDDIRVEETTPQTTNPSGVGAASPSTVIIGGSTLLT